MMRNCLAAFTCLTLLLGNAFAQEAGNPPAKELVPHLYKVTEINRDFIELLGAGGIVRKPALRDLQVYDVAGKKLTANDLLQRVRVGNVVVGSADENKVATTFLSVFKEDTLVLVGVNTSAHGWSNELAAMKFPDQPLAGKIHGVDFKADSVELNINGMQIRSGKDMIFIFLNLKAPIGKQGEAAEGAKFEIDSGMQFNGQPAVHIHVLSTTPPRLGAHGNGYSMRLEFGSLKNGTIPGKMYLCLPDEQKSWCAGSFTVTVR